MWTGGYGNYGYGGYGYGGFGWTTLVIFLLVVATIFVFVGGDGKHGDGGRR